MNLFCDRTGLQLPARTRTGRGPASRRGFVDDEVCYLLHACGTNHFKLGATANLFARHAQLQTGCPLFLDVAALWCGPRTDAFELERCLLLEADRRGWTLNMHGEWFTAAFDPRVHLDGVAASCGALRLSLRDYSARLRTYEVEA